MGRGCAFRMILCSFGAEAVSENVSGESHVRAPLQSTAPSAILGWEPSLWEPTMSATPGDEEDVSVSRSGDEGRRDLRHLNDELARVIEIMVKAHDLTEADREFLELRWRDQTVFMKDRVIRNRRSFYLLRWLAVVGAVAIPALVSLTVTGSAAAGIRWATFTLSLVVAVATAWETLFRYGRRWRLYRRSLDRMRAEGWAFAAQIGSYKGKKGKEALEAFASTVEGILRDYSEDYIQWIFEPDKKDEGLVALTLAEPTTTRRE